MSAAADGLQVQALHTPLLGPIDVAVAPGACVAIRGASGSGKSLLLRAIVDLDLNEGRVRIDGADRARMPAWRWRTLVALVPAESGWWADTVGEHFAGDDPADDIRALGLPVESLAWDVARLSSGERHRLAIARALQAKPRALLLDEPTAALDEHARDRLEALLRARCAQGMAVLLVTHDAGQPARLGARTLWLADGRLHDEEPADEAVNDP